MAKKALAGLLLAFAAVFAAPAAAHAVYTPEEDVVVSGSTAPGGTTVVTIEEAFTPGEPVSFSVTGEDGFTLAAFKLAPVTQSITKTADGSGSAAVAINLPTDARGTYTITATGVNSGNVATASFQVAVTGNGSNNGGTLPDTGSDVSMLALWAGAGALLLGAGLVATMTIVRRQREAQD